jgi:hypothetical protein
MGWYGSMDCTIFSLWDRMDGGMDDVHFTVSQVACGLCFLNLSLSTEQFTTCVHRSLLRITHSSSMTDIENPLRITSIKWYASNILDDFSGSSCC